MSAQLGQFIGVAAFYTPGVSHRALLLLLGLGLLALVGLVGWTFLVGPALVDALERLADRGAPIEYVLRAHFAYATGLVGLALLFALFARPPRDRRLRIVLVALLLEGAVLLGLWLLDEAPFRGESSALTFFSAAVLLVAAGLAALNVPAALEAPRPHRFARGFWALIGGAFVMAGIDEYFTVHEKIGHALEPFAARTGLPDELFQDGVTALYALGALGFVLLFFRCFTSELLRPGQLAGWLLLAGIGLYGLAVVNDSLDAVAEWLVPLANPEHAMNFAEELLEFTAAVLFACSFGLALLERQPEAFDEIWPAAPDRPLVRRVAAVGLTLAFVIALAIPLALRLALPNQALALLPVGAFEVSVFADAGDGLESVDELAYAPGLGLLAGIEGTGQVLLFDEAGSARVFVSGLSSPDGLAVGRGIVYVADEDRPDVLVFGSDGAPLRSVGSNWEGPEGLAVDDASGALYVADEPRRLVVRVRGESAEVVASAVDGLQAPEQLALDERGNLYIADERAGTVFRRTPDGRIDAFVGDAQGLMAPESLTVHGGHLYVSDSRLSQVHRYDLDGNGGIHLAFPRMRGDLAGIAAGPDGALFLAIGSEYRPYNRILRIRPLAR